MSTKAAWIFDVDGVLTHPSEKRVTELALFDEIEKRLKSDQPVILNTGRSVEFVDKEIFEPLLAHMDDRTWLKDFLMVCEKGAMWVTFDEEGRRKDHIDASVSVPSDIQEVIRSLVENTYSESTFFDETKKTMISVEMKDGYSVDAFKKIQKNLDADMQAILDVHPRKDDFHVDTTRIASDMQANRAGKHLGATRILDWMEDRGFDPESFVCFGDGLSDIAMADEFYSEGKKTVFVFVGEHTILDGIERAYEVVITEGHCEAGALEYLQAH